MKKKSPPYAIIVALLVGVLGIFLLFKWKGNMDAANAAALDQKTKDLQSQIDALKAQPQISVPQTDPNMRKVYYATQAIEAGAKISPAFYEEKLTPNNILPDAYADGADIVGFYAIRPLEPGDPLTPHNIDRTLPYLSERIPAGMRAVALPIFNGSINNTGGFAVDGDKVDILFTKYSTDGQILIGTQVALQNVPILFIPGPQTRSDVTTGITPTPTPGTQLSVTFLVTPEQAEALVFYMHVKNGEFSMILRGRTDVAEEKIKPVDAVDYGPDNLKRLQKLSDASIAKVDALQKKIQEAEDKEKAQAAAPGNTNETNHPAPPSP